MSNDSIYINKQPVHLSYMYSDQRHPGHGLSRTADFLFEANMNHACRAGLAIKLREMADFVSGIGGLEITDATIVIVCNGKQTERQRPRLPDDA